jgi:hypothetical protein
MKKNFTLFNMFGACWFFAVKQTNNSKLFENPASNNFVLMQILMTGAFKVK